MQIQESKFETELINLVFHIAELTSALWVHIYIFEITLRDSLNNCMARLYGTLNWKQIPHLLSKHHQEIVARSLSKNRLKHHMSETPNSAFSLSFWVELLSGRYHNKVWVHFQKHLNNFGGPREDFYNKVREIRNLRNAIAHHAPILRRNLIRDHAYLHELTSLLDPHLADEVQKRSRVLDLLLNARLVGSGGGI